MRTSTLPLLMTAIGADHPDHTLAADNFAIPANFLDGGSNFHGYTQLVK
jgi:hypothetical protein